MFYEYEQDTWHKAYKGLIWLTVSEGSAYSNLSPGTWAKLHGSVMCDRRAISITVAMKQSEEFRKKSRQDIASKDASPQWPASVH